jgi:hypothetical protein
MDMKNSLALLYSIGVVTDLYKFVFGDVWASATNCCSLFTNLVFLVFTKLSIYTDEKYVITAVEAKKSLKLFKVFGIFIVFWTILRISIDFYKFARNEYNINFIFFFRFAVLHPLEILRYAQRDFNDF